MSDNEIYISIQELVFRVSAATRSSMSEEFSDDLIGYGWQVDENAFLTDVQQYVGDKFDDAHSQVDRSVHNPSRITKVIGTNNYIGIPIAIITIAPPSPSRCATDARSPSGSATSPPSPRSFCGTARA